jgi:excisionase family DNA binding protein
VCRRFRPAHLDRPQRAQSPAKASSIRTANKRAPDHRLEPAVLPVRAEVADVMRVSRLTAYRLVLAGTLPAVQVGRSLRIPEQTTVQDYLRDSYIRAG